MQNPHVKYLKQKNSFHLFYYEHGNILCRHYTAEVWSAPQKIAEKAAPVFSLCQYQETAHLLYSNREGQLFLASSANLTQWEHHSMAEEVRAANNAKFFLLPTENTLHLIYHRPTESTGIDALLYTSLRNGKWEKPYQIDRFLPMPKTSFLARRLSSEHIILYYRTARNVISAREMLLEPYTMGSVTPLLQTPAPCIDLSIVNDSEKIHILSVIRGMFRTQVVYQYKHTSAISTPRILWEDSGCDNCLAYLQEGRLVLLWTANGQPMRCIFENAAFSAVEKITEPFPARCIKAELVGAETDTFNSTEWYGDAQFFPLFFPPASAEKAAPPETDAKQQLEELSLLLAQRSDEIAAVNARWKAHTEHLEQELYLLREENAQLKHSLAAQKTEL